jgi:predicted NAD/FAD-binding protein
MRIAVIGSGISGMLSAYLLSEDHDVVVFEANDYIGGHTHTIDVERNGKTYPVDTGFIVFNEKTYPNFIRLMKRLGVAWQNSNMSFGVKCEKTGLEFCSSSLNNLFAQRSNLLRPSFYRMILDIFRFRRESQELLTGEHDEMTLAAYLELKQYSKTFIQYFILPMGAAVWSADPEKFRDFPARYFVEFFTNHGFLTRSQPQWLTIKGGSKQYVAQITKPYQDHIRLKTPVESVKRHPDYVEVKTRDGKAERFDHVVIATHSDQALAMLDDPSDAERDILGAIPYQPNLAVLHTDASILPRRKLAWASWNYHIPREELGRVAVTYNMNKLQSIDAPVVFCVTLNRPDEIDPAQIIEKIQYHHPVYTPQGLAARKRRDEINGVNRTYFCGAYWSYGFHEDGVNSALSVCKHFGKTLTS